MKDQFTFSAENILPGHPDRICDAVAEEIVHYACSEDPHALVGVEVALHRSLLVITGRVAATVYAIPVDEWPLELGDEKLQELVGRAFAEAGYIGDWAHQVKLAVDLDVGGLEDDERAIRGFSDDQTIAVGYAEPGNPSMLPIEVYAARRIKDALAEARAQHPYPLGPDGKILVTFTGDLNTPRLSAVNISIQHRGGVGFLDLHDMVLPEMTRAIEEIGAHTEIDLRGDWFRLNGIGDFTCGGPMGDNGLSGKKLVVDHYGPRIPIGGGAICGKDVHKPDRVGALRSRQIARRLATATGETARVELGWLPGLEAPDRLSAELGNGRRLTAKNIAREIALPDLSLAGSAKELELAAVPWPAVMRSGYFGDLARAWER